MEKKLSKRAVLFGLFLSVIRRWIQIHDLALGGENHHA